MLRLSVSWMLVVIGLCAAMATFCVLNTGARWSASRSAESQVARFDAGTLVDYDVLDVAHDSQNTGNRIPSAPRFELVEEEERDVHGIAVWPSLPVPVAAQVIGSNGAEPRPPWVHWDVRERPPRLPIG